MRYVIPIFALSMAMGSLNSSSKPVEVQLNVAVKGSKVWATLTFTNASSQEIQLEKYKVHFGTVYADNFEITNGEKKIPYTKELSKRILRDRNFFKLCAGKKLTTQIDLTQLYDFSSGTHRYKVRYCAFPIRDQVIELTSNSVIFTYTK